MEVTMESLGEQTDVRQLQDRIVELETALADAHLDLRLTRAWAQLARRPKTHSPDRHDTAPVAARTPQPVGATQ
jgi:hypothetical protein